MRKLLFHLRNNPLWMQKRLQMIMDGDEKKKFVDSKDRDSGLAKVDLEKRWALIKAWEESERNTADNKAYKKLSTVEAWENTKKAAITTELEQIEEEFEKKAKWGETMKNKIAELAQGS